MQNDAAPKVINCRRTSADLYESAPRAAPVTQNEAAPKVINCHQTSADLYEGAPSAAPAAHAAQNEPEVLQALRRPKSSIVTGLPRTSMKVLQGLRLPRKTRRRPKSSIVTRLPRTSMKVLQVLRLPRMPRKASRRCSKCCACHAKRAGGAPSAAPATKKRRGTESHQLSTVCRGPL